VAFEPEENRETDASQTERDREVLVLSPRDSKAFATLLLTPPGPNAALRQAADFYKTVMGDGGCLGG
jgi:uncharacterized protein (DUF1778 family)